MMGGRDRTVQHWRRCLVFDRTKNQVDFGATVFAFRCYNVSS